MVTDNREEAAFRDFFAGELRSESAACPRPNFSRLVLSHPGKPRARGRTVLSHLGFAACFLFVSATALTEARSKPGALWTHIDQLESSDQAKEGLRVVMDRIRGAYAEYRAEKMHKAPRGQGPLGPKETL